MKAQIIQGPDQIALARLMVLKQAVKLESVGMKHSSGKSMRKMAAVELGYGPQTGIDTVIGALEREINRQLKAGG
jgi:hypothetical protein